MLNPKEFAKALEELSKPKQRNWFKIRNDLAESVQAEMSEAEEITKIADAIPAPRIN